MIGVRHLGIVPTSTGGLRFFLQDDPHGAVVLVSQNGPEFFLTYFDRDLKQPKPSGTLATLADAIGSARSFLTGGPVEGR